MTPAIEKRAKEIYRAMKPTCSCGGDSYDTSWHHESCATEQAWDVAVDRATDEAPEHEVARGEYLEER